MTKNQKDSVRYFLRFLPDRLYVQLYYFFKYKRFLNLKEPKTLHEKLQYLKLYDHKPFHTQLVDKYLVKNIVAKIIGDEYIIPTLGCWDRVEDIDYMSLPEKFVLKCNHNSASLFVCTDKKLIDVERINSEFRKALNQNYYYISREIAYRDVDRKIIAEKYISNTDGSPLADYKFYCYGGQPQYFMYSLGEAEHNVRNHKFDMNCNSIDYLFKKIPKIDVSTIKLPENFPEMKKIVEKLCANFQHVRIDLYNVDGKIYFGEITLNTNGGLIDMYNQAFSQYLADLIKIN